MGSAGVSTKLRIRSIASRVPTTAQARSAASVTLAEHPSALPRCGVSDTPQRTIHTPQQPNASSRQYAIRLKFTLILAIHQPILLDFAVQGVESGELQAEDGQGFRHVLLGAPGRRRGARRRLRITQPARLRVNASCCGSMSMSATSAGVIRSARSSAINSRCRGVAGRLSYQSPSTLKATITAKKPMATGQDTANRPTVISKAKHPKEVFATRSCRNSERSARRFLSRRSKAAASASACSLRRSSSIIRHPSSSGSPDATRLRPRGSLPAVLLQPSNHCTASSTDLDVPTCLPS